MEERSQEREYIAFISYRHMPLDKEAAERIQKKIENYRIPKELRKSPDEGGIPKAGKLGKVFRDEDELPASSSLTDSIYYALDHSEFLIVICTPDLPKSKWCEAEIRYFLETHDRDHVLAVLTDGTPEESFSPYLLHEYDEEGNVVRDIEPLAANIAGDQHTINKKIFQKECTRICAALIGCPFDALWQREKRARTNRMLTAAGLAVAVLGIFLGVVMNRNARIEAQNQKIQEQNDRITAQNDELTEKNEEIKEQNGRITDQNEKIEEQNVELQRQLSTVLVDSGLSKLKNYDTKGAIRDALSALESDDPSVYDHRAEKLLADALGAYKYGELKSSLVYEQDTEIMAVCVTDDNQYAVLLDGVGVVRCLDLNTYEIVWKHLTKDENTVLYTKGLGKKILAKSADALVCLSVENGDVLWSYEQDTPNYFQCITDDGAKFAVLDTDPEEMGERVSEDKNSNDWLHHIFRPVFVVFLDTENGKELGRSALEASNYGIRQLNTEQKPRAYGTDFSPDGSKFCCMMLFDPKNDEAEHLYCKLVYVIDTETFEPVLYAQNSLDHEPDRQLDFYFGMEINDSADYLFVARNESQAALIIFNTVRVNGSGEFEFSTQNAPFSFASKSGAAGSKDEEVQKKTPPLLSGDDRQVICTDRDVFIYDKTEDTLLRDLILDCDIVNAYWIRENAAEVVTSDGTLHIYDFASDLGELGSIISYETDLSGIRLICPVKNGGFQNPKDGGYLSALKESRGKLLRSEPVKDSSGEMLLVSGGKGEKEDRETSQDSVPSFLADQVSFSFSNDSDLGMAFIAPRTVFTFDRHEWKILGQYEVSEDFNSNYLNEDCIILDDTHFLQNNTVYSLEDGSTKPFATEVNEAVEEYLQVLYLYQHRQLDDGRILTSGVADLTRQSSSGQFSYYLFYPCWLDQAFVGLEVLVNEDQNPIPVVSDTGLLYCYGKSIQGENDEYMLHILDVAKGTTNAYVNVYPEGGQGIAALGTTSRQMAVYYETGNLCVYDFDTDESVQYFMKNTDPESGEAFSALNDGQAICYCEGDRYLLILSSVGQLSIIDRETGNRVMQEFISCFRENMQYIGSYLHAELSADEKTMLVSAGYANSYNYTVILDTETWDERAVCYAGPWDQNENRIYSVSKNADGRGSYGIIAYPLHDLEALKEWGESVVGSGISREQ